MLFQDKHHVYMSVQFRLTYTPLLCSNTGVYRGIHIFLIFAHKHIVGSGLNRLIETALTCTPTICFVQKLEKYNNFSFENYHFYSHEKLQDMHKPLS